MAAVLLKNTIFCTIGILWLTFVNRMRKSFSFTRLLRVNASCCNTNYLGEGGAGTPIRCWIMDNSMSEYCCIIWTISGLDSVCGCGEALRAGRSSSTLSPAGGNCRPLRLWMTGVAAEESNCSSSARSLSDRFDSEPDSEDEPTPPASRR